MANIYYLPSGPKNLQSLFSSIRFFDVAEYFLEVLDTQSNVIGTTPKTQVVKCADAARIHFINRLGCIDALSFEIQEITHETKSDNFQRSLTAQKWEHGVSRINVKANDSYRCINCDYEERDLPYLDELFDSPLHWLEWEGTQGQADSYLPIVLLDAKVSKRKEEDRFVNEVQVEFKLSREKIIIRN